MWTRIRLFLRAVLRRNDLETGMNDEMRFHVEEHTARLIREGVPEEEARRRARLDFGSLPATLEACRESRGVNFADELRRNVQYALRLLRRNPGFAATAILTLALGIGANTAIFSVIDAVLLRPLPYPEPERLVRVVTELRRSDGAVAGIGQSQDGYAWETLNQHESSVAYAAFSGLGSMPVAREGHGEYIPAQRVTAGFFRVLGVPLHQGREFLPEEDAPGGPAVVIIGHDLWMRYFQGDPSAVGSSVHVRGEPHTIVGIAPAGLQTLGTASLWTPLRVTRTGEGSGTNYSLFGRIRDGISFEEADGRVAAAGETALRHRKFEANTQARLMLVPLQEGMVGNNRTPLLVIWAAVGLVLVIACVNVAGLLLARAETRAREVATRAALGGGTGAVLRQLITESVVLSLLGGIAGIALAYGGIRLLTVYVTEALGIWQPVLLDTRVLVLSLGVSVLTGLVFGLAPAMQTLRVNLRDALTAGGTRGVAGGGGHWPRRILVAGEVGLCLVLLIGAGLLIRTFLHIYNLPPGFDGTNVITTSVSMNDVRYADAARAGRYFTRTLEGIRAIPGVETAAVGLHIPFDRWLNLGVRTTGPSQEGGMVGTTANYVTAGYFEALRIPIVAGREIRESDNEGAALVAVVNETFVRRYFADRDPIGQAVAFGGKNSQWVTIIGVAADVQQSPGLTRGAPVAPEPAVYVPVHLLGEMFTMIHTWFSPKWVIRGHAGPSPLVPQIQQVFATVDPLLPTTTFRPVEAYRGDLLRFERAQLVLLGILAALALVLGAVGVYGLVSHQVTERTREMGIRIVLGASHSQAIRSAAFPGITLALVGLAVGIGLAAASTRFLESRLFGVQPLDVPTFVVAAGFLLAVAALASVLPALRLLRLNPAETLRMD